ncbi:MAG: glycoside-pentoside-hexuronide (GPH):cation symporter [Clostridia bacterium]|nr:glycoside-pentoside-hexuronide (GPH):cation symporter [Clostridia bacterium]
MKLKFKEKFFYGLGDLSANIMFAAISFYLLYFFVNVGGLKAELASAVFLIAKFWDAFTDYLMGRISDKTKSKWGKRRVYMLFGAVPYGLAFLLLWIAPFGESAQVGKMIYYTLAYMLFNTAWTVVYIPYNAITANMTDNYDERTSLNGIRIALANVGIILGAALFALFADGQESLFYQLFGNARYAYLMSAGIFAFISIVIMLLCAGNIKERVDDAEQNDKGFFVTLKEFFKLPEFRNVMLCYLLSMVGFDIIMAVFMFFINDSLGFSGGAMAMVFVAIPLVCAIASSFVWVKLSEKFNKHKVYTIACIYMAVVLIFAIFVPAKNIATTILLCVFAGFGMSAIQILPYASVPDVVEVDEYVNGSRREGAYYGITQFMYKVANGVSIALVSAVLGAFGYIESTDGTAIQQPDSALLAVRIVLGALPGVIFLISIIFSHRANLSRERFASIKAELDIRRAKSKTESNNS